LNGGPPIGNIAWVKRLLPPGFACALLFSARLAAADPTVPAEAAAEVVVSEDGLSEPATEDGAPAPAPPEPVEPEAGLPEESPAEAGEPEPVPVEQSDPAPPEPQPTPSVAPPPPPPPAPAAPRGPLGLSPGATRTLGWVTLAVSTAAGIGLTVAGVAQCQGQSLACIQGQPLIWSGAAIGLGGIPLGLTLIVRGHQLSVGGPVALVLGSGRSF